MSDANQKSRSDAAANGEAAESVRITIAIDKETHKRLVISAAARRAADFDDGRSVSSLAALILRESGET